MFSELGSYNGFFLFSTAFLAVTIFFCFLRGVLGPRFTDRIAAVNMIGTKTIVLISVLAVLKEESYLVDICLIYALISFLSVAVLSKTYLAVYSKQSKEQENKCMGERYD